MSNNATEKLNNKRANDSILFEQRRLNMKFFAVWLMVITTIQWMMVDMYLPALPVLKETFGCSESLLNVSLNTGIICSAFGTLIGGMLSDKYGRKSVLLVGLFMASICSLACMLANGIALLAIMRGIGGLGSGFAQSITAAMVKDSFSGKKFQTTMTVMQSVAVMGPLISPAVGSLLINVMSWRLIFLFLGVATALSAIPMIISDDTLPAEKRISGGFGNLMREVGGIASNKAFMLFLAILSMLTIPVWAYIAVSSYVYIEEFALSNLKYSIFYACGSAQSILAPFVYMLLCRYFKTGRVVTISILVLLFGALELLLGGRLNPVMFMIGALALMLTEGIIRPLTMIVILEENPDRVGSASALTNFTANAVGLIGTSIATLGWQSMVIGVGLISLGCMVVAVICWIAIIKNKMLQGSLNQ